MATSLSGAWELPCVEAWDIGGGLSVTQVVLPYLTVAG